MILSSREVVNYLLQLTPQLVLLIAQQFLSIMQQALLADHIHFVLYVLLLLILAVLHELTDLLLVGLFFLLLFLESLFFKHAL